MAAGLYIVRLTNRDPISVNAHDVRRAQSSIYVTCQNCKIGKATVLEGRHRNYFRTFGKHAIFRPLVELAPNAIAQAERKILLNLNSYRIRGRTGMPNEWLQGILPEAVEQVVFETLIELRVPYIRV